jgi:hypothetical protein
VKEGSIDPPKKGSKPGSSFVVLAKVYTETETHTKYCLLTEVIPIGARDDSPLKSTSFSPTEQIGLNETLLKYKERTTKLYVSDILSEQLVMIGRGSEYTSTNLGDIQTNIKKLHSLNKQSLEWDKLANVFRIGLCVSGVCQI